MCLVFALLSFALQFYVLCESKATLPKPWHKLIEHVENKIMQLMEKWNKIFKINSILIIATFGVVLKMSVYCYDLNSDVQVIQELENKNFAFPTFQFKEQHLEHFLLKEVKEVGIPALTEPCELLDLFEEIPEDKIPFYFTLISNISNIHWNPNRNSELHLSDVFDVLKELFGIYNDSKKIIGSNNLEGYQASGMSVSEIINQIEEMERALKKTKSGLTGKYQAHM